MLETTSNITFISEPRSDFRAATSDATKKNHTVGTYAATQISYAEKLDGPDECTAEISGVPQAWVLGHLTKGASLQDRARYATVSLPTGAARIMILEESDFQEESAETMTVSLKLYGMERWLYLVPGSVANADKVFAATDTYATAIKDILESYSTGLPVELYGDAKIPFRDLPILPYDATYAPTPLESSLYGVAKYDPAQAASDGHSAAVLASKDLGVTYPEPQGEKLFSLCSALPYDMGNNTSELRQRFRPMLIPAASPYADGCLWWRWAICPVEQKTIYASRESGSIADAGTLHIGGNTSALRWLPADSTGKTRRSQIAIAGSVQVGPWMEADSAEASADGVSSSQMSLADASAIAAAAAAGLNPVSIDLTADATRLTSEVMPGMKAIVRMGDGTLTMRVSEVDFGFDADSGWSIKLPISAATDTIDYTKIVPDPNPPIQPDNPDDPYIDPVTPPVEPPEIPDYPDGPIPGTPDFPGIPDIPDTPDIPPAPDPNNPVTPPVEPGAVDIHLTDAGGINPGRMGVLITKDGRCYAITIPFPSGEKNVAPWQDGLAVKKIDGPAADAKLVWADNTKGLNQDFFIASAGGVSGQTLYRVRLTQSGDTAATKITMANGDLTGTFVDMSWRGEPVNSGYVSTTAGVYSIAVKDLEITFTGTPGIISGIVQVQQRVGGSYDDKDEYYTILAKSGVYKGDGTLLMSPPKGAKPLLLVGGDGAVWSTGFYTSDGSAEGKNWKKTSAGVGGKIVEATSIGGNPALVLVRTTTGIYASYEAGSSKMAFQPVLSEPQGLTEFHATGFVVENSYVAFSVIAAVQGGGLITAWSKDGKNWTTGAFVPTDQITHILGWEDQPWVGLPAAGADLAKLTPILFSTDAGIFEPSESYTQPQVAERGLKIAAGDHPLVYTATLDDGTVSWVGGRSVWASATKTISIETYTGAGPLPASAVKDITGSVGIISAANSSNNYILMVSPRGIMDTAGKRKDSGISINNPRLISDRAGGFYVGCDEGLYRVRSGTLGQEGAASTMSREIPAASAITIVGNEVTAGPTETWIGRRQILNPLGISSDNVLDSLDLNLIACILVKSGSQPAGFASNLLVAAGPMQYTTLTAQYASITRILGDDITAQSPLTGMWDDAAVGISQDGTKYCFIAHSQNYASQGETFATQEYSAPAGEKITAVIPGLGFITASGKTYSLKNNGTVSADAGDFSGATGIDRVISLSGLTLAHGSSGWGWLDGTTSSFAPLATLTGDYFGDYYISGINLVVTTTGIWQVDAPSGTTPPKVSQQLANSGIRFFTTSAALLNYGEHEALFIDATGAHYFDSKKPVKCLDGANLDFGIAADGVLLMWSTDGVWALTEYEGLLTADDAKLRLLPGLRFDYTRISGEDAVSVLVAEADGTMAMLQVADRGDYPITATPVSGWSCKTAKRIIYNDGGNLGYSMIVLSQDGSWSWVPPDGDDYQAVHTPGFITSDTPIFDQRRISAWYTNDHVPLAVHDDWAFYYAGWAWQAPDRSLGKIREVFPLTTYGGNASNRAALVLADKLFIVYGEAPTTKTLIEDAAQMNFVGDPMSAPSRDRTTPPLISSADGSLAAIMMEKTSSGADFSKTLPVALTGITGKVLAVDVSYDDEGGWPNIAIACSTDGCWIISWAGSANISPKIVAVPGAPKLTQIPQMAFTESFEAATGIGGGALIAPTKADGGGLWAIMPGNLPTDHANPPATPAAFKAPAPLDTTVVDILRGQAGWSQYASGVVSSGEKTWSVALSDEGIAKPVEITEMIRKVAS